MHQIDAIRCFFDLTRVAVLYMRNYRLLHSLSEQRTVFVIAGVEHLRSIVLRLVEMVLMDSNYQCRLFIGN